MNAHSINTPLGWSKAIIGDLIGGDGVFIDGDWVESKDQDPNGDVRLIQLADVGDGAYHDKSARFLSHAKARELKCTFLHPGDLLIARMPEPLGRACIFPGDRRQSVTVVDVCVVRSGEPGVNHRWLMHTINAPQFRSRVASLQSGSTRKRISRGNLATLEVPVPPKVEQDRIVAEIERQFSILDAGVQALKRIQAKLKRYRASVLQAACTGRLVPTEAELARAEGRDYEPADSLRHRALRGCRPACDRMHQQPTQTSNLAEGWAWTTVEQICEFTRYGTSAKTSSDSSGVPVLRMGNIQEGQVDLNLLKYLPEEHHEFPDLLLRKGDLLFNRTNSAELVGKSAVYEGNPSPCSYASYLIAVRMLSSCLPQYLGYFINSPIGRAWVKTVVSQQVGQANVNGSKLRSLMVALPPIAEQERIVLEVERQMSLVRQTEAAVTANLKRAGRLRQSILNEAFEGRLVPQDPTDEPAGHLLERIKEARAETIGRNGKRPRRGVPKLDRPSPLFPMELPS